MQLKNELYGLIGEKLGHSFSPQIHDEILKSLNLKGSYNLYEVKEENLEYKIKELKADGSRGINVTIPYKTKVMQYLDIISPAAEKIGAVNTIRFFSGLVSGFNTDYFGFGAALKNSNIDIKDKSAVILGTGGASRAVVQYLVDSDIKDVIFASRNPEKAAAENNKNYKIISYDDMDKLLNEDIIINCTPCGMYPYITNCPVREDIIRKFSTAVDLIYNPEDTMFLRKAEKLGLKTTNGLYMLVAQAAASQEIWQDIKIDKMTVDKIYEAVKARINM
jgi:shikimate dehydrogenase